MGKIIPVILCGGSGTRLWPLSNPSSPKQFLNLLDPAQSLLQKTFHRALYLTDASPNSIILVTGQSHAALAKEQLGEYSPHILTETASRNTAPAIALAADYVSRQFSPDTLMFIMPSDAHIENEDALQQSLAVAISEASKGNIALFGIKPSHPETGYGYIKINQEKPYGVECFIEKPDQETALSYLQSGDYLWNSGMSIFKASTVIKEFQTYAPHILNNLHDYSNITSMSFDVAILEKTFALSVIPCDLKWCDIGTWQGLWEILQKTASEDNEIYKLAKSRQG